MASVRRGMTCRSLAVRRCAQPDSSDRPFRGGALCVAQGATLRRLDGACVASALQDRGSAWFGFSLPWLSCGTMCRAKLLADGAMQALRRQMGHWTLVAISVRFMLPIVIADGAMPDRRAQAAVPAMRGADGHRFMSASAPGFTSRRIACLALHYRAGDEIYRSASRCVARACGVQLPASHAATRKASGRYRRCRTSHRRCARLAHVGRRSTSRPLPLRSPAVPTAWRVPRSTFWVGCVLRCVVRRARGRPASFPRHLFTYWTRGLTPRDLDRRPARSTRCASRSRRPSGVHTASSSRRLGCWSRCGSPACFHRRPAHRQCRLVRR